MFFLNYYRSFRTYRHKFYYNPTIIGLLLNFFSPTYWIVYRSWNHLNILKTLWVNFHYLPFRVALNLPIYIYGNCKFMRANGNIEIEANNIVPGMIRINKSVTSPCNSSFPTEFLLTMGKIIFRGKAFFATGCRIIVNNGGTLIIGDNVRVNNQNTIGCFNRIQLGDNCEIGHQNQIFDTNFHHIIDIENNRIMRSNAPVIIGANTWLGNRITILHGVTLPPYTIVSSNSLVTKSIEKSYWIIGGIPAKLLKSGMKRLFDKKLEADIHQFFSKSTDRFFQL